MISYKEILFTVTKILSNNFDCDIIVDNSSGTFENECLFVSIIPIENSKGTKDSNYKSIIISIKYFGNGDKLKLYEVANTLEGLFKNEIKVDNVNLDISNIEPNFLNDEIGNMLDFLVYTKLYEMEGSV